MDLQKLSFGVIGDAGELGAERAQAKDRIAVSCVVLVGMAIWLIFFAQDMSALTSNTVVLSYIPAFLGFSVLLYIHIVMSERIIVGRRYLAMVMDYIAIAMMVSLGGEVFILLFAILIRITLGYGLRYGPTYLVAATIMALATLGVITFTTPYWREHPLMVGAFALTTIIVPTYAMALLRRVDEAREAAQVASLQKSRFLAQASHDLRQPVHAIGLFIESLRRTNLSLSQVAVVDRIDRSLQGVARLFRSLLDISTLDSGAVTPKAEPVQLGSFFAELEQQNAAMAAWSDTELVFVKSSLTVTTDNALLTTMMQNLISNALKYAPGRTVLVGCRRHKNTVSLHVVDRGEGVEAHHLPHLTEDFYQVRQLGAPDIQGVGLGLAIVNRLAIMMGLQLEIRSVPDKGTSAIIHGIPLREALPLQPQTRLSAISDGPLAGIRIILIEDDSDVLEATSELLASWGCIISAYNVLPERTQSCDMIIVDFDIGHGMTGADCITLLRERHGANIPAIMMTGHDEMRVKGILKDPEVPILKKPVRPAELRSLMVATQLRSRHGGIGRP
ncbi:MAG: ATP-binding response regulator [Beijerinckiaceae bacterium]